MGRKITFILLFVAFFGLPLSTYAQMGQGPPEPTLEATQGAGRPPCGVGNGGSNGKGVPPPVGLCLPINDYLLPLFLAGIVFGSYKVWRIQKAVDQ
ncbi:hypothetical protein [Salinimicrobium flavum]|uniref:Cobalt/nickel transport protein n=1 Tax=Salinimicrobium flavum TaxID=1737065 RepID=A0ABW5IYT7_9FLAO